MKTIGIDPGITGAAVCLDDDRRIVDYIIMPTYQDGTKKAVDSMKLSDWISEQGADLAALEKVSARPGQGVVSMFSFGRSYGAAEAALACQRIPYVLVRPQDWRKPLDLSGCSKDEVRERALEYFCVDILKTKIKGRAVADAAYIALWGAMNEGR